MIKLYLKFHDIQSDISIIVILFQREEKLLSATFYFVENEKIKSAIIFSYI